MTTPLSFQSPALLWGLLALPVVAAAYLLAQRRRTRYAVRFTNVELLAGLLPHTPPWRRHLPAALSFLSLAALLLGAGRPQAMIPIPKEQATVVMVMDTSGSMAAADVQPSRIAAARQAAKTFLDVVPSDFKISVIGFASTVQTLVRPTDDRVVVRRALDSLYADGGTAMGDAIQRAVEVAKSAQPPQPTPTAVPATATPPAQSTQPAGARPSATPTDVPAPAPPAAILLLSDGANSAGRVQPLDAARAAKQAGIPVYAIALGTPDGTLEVPGLQGGGRRLVQRIQVPPDEETLKQVAAITGGQFFAAPSAGDLRAIYRDIGSRIGFEYERQEVTFAFAAAGAVLLAASAALALGWFQRFP